MNTEEGGRSELGEGWKLAKVSISLLKLFGKIGKEDVKGKPIYYHGYFLREEKKKKKTTSQRERLEGELIQLPAPKKL